MTSRWLGFALVALSAPTVVACGGGGPPPDLEVEHNQAPAGGTCELDGEGGGGSIDEGTFDLVLGDRSTYVLTPLVRNRTDTEVIIEAVRVRIFRNRGEDETERIRIRCDDGELCDEWELDPCDPRAVPSCPVVPADGTASFEMPILPRLVTGYFQGLLDAAVREGRTPPEFDLEARFELLGTAGAAPVDSETFAFPVRLCLGCLVEFPPGSDDPAIEGPDCCGGGLPLEACYPGQDEPVDCRRCVSIFPELCNFGRPSCG